ncbi:ribonuclease T2-like protein [Coniochaeta sp. 2T2.1]|nr:ribonuclease T2-like protein [Coniochaeta sp. 2T2.1]
MLPSIPTIMAYSALLAQTHFVHASSSNGNAHTLLTTEANLPSPYVPLSGSVSCPIDGPMSCHNNTPIAGDSCCFVYPGGRMLLTQFWDAEEQAPGSDKDWTIHGLWPDLCNGTYDAYCRLTPSYPNITAVLLSHNATSLLSYMTRYWTAAWGSASHLWAHEYNKHGTCINTLSSSCYSSYTPGVEVVDYFSRAASLHKTLDTYTALKKAGIAPKRDERYPLAEVKRALEEYSGGRVVLRCTGRGDVLHEAWYVFFVQGSLQSGEFVPAAKLGREGGAGNCKPWVRYLPKRPRRGAAEVAAEEEEEL